MTVENGGTVIDISGILSSDPTSFGSLTLDASGGTGTTWYDEIDPTDTLNTRGYMLVGNDNQSTNLPSPAPAGTAELVVQNTAALVEALYAQIGNTADSAGSATITSNGVWTIGTSVSGGFLNVGNAGSGTLTVSDNGTVDILPGTGSYTSNGTTATGGQGLEVGRSATANGTVMVFGGGVLNVDLSSSSAGGVNIGQSGQGLMDIYGGGSVIIVNSPINVGRSLGSVGTLIVGGFSPGVGDVVGGTPGIGVAGGSVPGSPPRQAGSMSGRLAPAFWTSRRAARSI